MRPILAELSAGDLTLVIVTGCAIVSVGAILFVALRMLQVLRDLRVSLDRLDQQVVPLVDDLAVALAEASEELDRIDRLVGSAESISATVDATSKLAYRALSAPVIKTVAVTSGASRAARRIRRGN
jgi:hypothetical protein